MSGVERDDGGQPAPAASAVAIGADHAGFELKATLREFIATLGYRPIDLGTHSTEPVDYPDVARVVGEYVLAGGAQRGVLICGSGVGASIAANKLHGIRAGLCHDTYSAHQGVEHDDMNILVLGARVIGAELAAELVAAFLRARFTGEARHVRRVQKIAALENMPQSIGRERDVGFVQDPAAGFEADCRA